jgi:endonuclease/exonuclease/phosphatase family metal-dependent hydrolase
MDLVESLTFPDVHGFNLDDGQEDDVLFRDRIASVAFQVASYLTDPVCKAHESWRRVQIIDSLNPTSAKVVKVATQFFLCLAIASCALLAVFTTVPGIVLRHLAAKVQSTPYLYFTNAASGKVLPNDHAFTLLSWNICGTSAGHVFSDGGLYPWVTRIDAIIDKMVASDADVNCLYEVFDVKAATYITQRLKQHGYQHFYYNIGPRAVGVNSGILVASKYIVKAPEFTPYPEDALVGRTKYTSKGVFAFDLASEGKSFARIFATHLQHSEEPAFATSEEIEARRKQMQIIIDKMNGIRDRCVVLTGDLNLDDKEKDKSFWRGRFSEETLYYSSEKTWGGDEFSVKLVGDKRVSEALNLDHTLLLKGSGRALETFLISTGFDLAVLDPKALSDHAGLYSTIYA